MNTSEPSYRGITWEPSYTESYERLIVTNDSFAHDLEAALEWLLRRQADLGMGTPAEGLEVAKLFGHPRYSRSEGPAGRNPRASASSSGSSSMNRSWARTAHDTHGFGGHGDSAVEATVDGADLIARPHSAFAGSSRVTMCHIPLNSNHSVPITR